MGQLGTARAGLFYMKNARFMVAYTVCYELQAAATKTSYKICTQIDHPRNNTFCVFICSSVYVISLSRELHSVTKFTFKLSDK